MAKCKVDLNNFFNFSIQWHFTVGWPTFYVWFRTKTRITTMGGSHRYQNFIETIKYFWWWGVWRSQSTEILLLCNYGFYSWREVSTAIRHLVYSTYFITILSGLSRHSTMNYNWLKIKISNPVKFNCFWSYKNIFKQFEPKKLCKKFFPHWRKSNIRPPNFFVT